VLVHGVVSHLHRSPTYTFSKAAERELVLVAGMGVHGDAHFGATVRHRSRVAVDPTRPNLRQVHLLQGELLDELAESGFDVAPGDLGENITSRGIDLLGLSTGTVLLLGDEAIVALTGLRNPCRQIDDFQEGLLSHVLVRDEQGDLIRRAGVMGVVIRGGTVTIGAPIAGQAPLGPHVRLEPV
jgi:hypothetical protein